MLTSRLAPQCPLCKSRRIRRKPRRGFMQKHIYPLFLGYPYHCGSCQSNFILFIGRALKKPNAEKHARKRRTSEIY